MSQFDLENAIREATRMDSSINNKGVSWNKPRKALENTNTSFNISLNGSKLGGGSGLKRLSESLSRKTPSKTPRRSPSRLGTRSPGRAGSKSPGRNNGISPGRGADRFIPDRQTTDTELSHYKLTREEAEDREMMSPSKRDYQRAVQENLGIDLANTRVLSYQTKPPSAPDGHSNNLKILYSSSKSQSVKKVARHIPQAPERILDAPDILNDYYLNLVDWSNNNHLAVALGAHLYLWNAATGEIHQLCELQDENDYICSVRWAGEGGYLALGTSSGDIQLWDVECMRKLRTLSGHDTRVPALAWNKHVLSSGAKSGELHHSDVRVPEHCVSRSRAHSQEVCGLAWSGDGRYLASGGNDNVLNIWTPDPGHCHPRPEPVFSLQEHQAAVKALSWCPWQSNILASGGGTADRTIKIWNASNGTQLSSTDTKSQVCSLVWAREYKELVSSHGYANNEIIIWKYPSMERTAELTGHTERVLSLSMSPDGSTVVSAGADETLRLWKCFAPDPNKKKNEIKPKQQSSALRMGIR